jgi:hypothetical protein
MMIILLFLDYPIHEAAKTGNVALLKKWLTINVIDLSDYFGCTLFKCFYNSS